jgi:hypothetical protein
VENENSEPAATDPGAQPAGEDASILVVAAAAGYRILRVVGRGHLCHDPQALARFRRACAIAERLAGCPGVAGIFEQGVASGVPYLAMEHFAGGDLAQRIGPWMAPREALGLLVGLARTLAEAHAAGIAHGALSARKVLFRADGSMALAGFGGAQTPRDDIAALGIVFRQMLEGSADQVIREARLPFELTRFQPVLDRLLGLGAGRADPYRDTAQLIEDVEKRFPDMLAAQPALAGLQPGDRQAA